MQKSLKQFLKPLFLAFEERKHRRFHGKFADKPGSEEDRSNEGDNDNGNLDKLMQKIESHLSDREFRISDVNYDRIAQGYSDFSSMDAGKLNEKVSSLQDLFDKGGDVYNSVAALHMVSHDKFKSKNADSLFNKVFPRS